MTDDTLTSGDLKRIEHLLKKELARRMEWMQRDRALNHTSRNVGNARDYVETARALRRVLEQRGRQGYVPLWRMYGDGNTPDDVADRAGFDTRDRVLDRCEKLHRIGNPNLPPGTMTDHDSVPGTPG